MNKSPGWIWVNLVSTVHLAVLLGAVVLLFSWLGETTDSMLGQQTCQDCYAIGQQVAESIEANKIRDIRLSTAKDREMLDRIVSSVEFPGAGYIGVIDFGTGKSVSHYPKSGPDDPGLSGDAILFSLIDDCQPGLLCDQISNRPGHRSTNGRVHWLGNEYFINAQLLPQLDLILLIGQERSDASSRMMDMMQRSKGYAFAFTLLVGLISICITVLLVTRIGETVDNLNDGLEKVVSENARELVRTKNAVIFGLAKLAESRDNDTGEHLDRIRSYVTILAREVALNEAEFTDEFIRNLGLASSLHDIGKVGIPDSILLKPGRLTMQEREIMEVHTLIGGECLDAIQARLGENEFMHIARQIAYYHHERWDGAGYPHSLKGTEIPLVARIVAVADVYDALTSKRPYKNAMTHQESKAIIVAGSGHHFDPAIVKAFLRHEDEFEEISFLQQSLSDEEATSSFHRLCESVKNGDDSSELVTDPVAVHGLFP